MADQFSDGREFSETVWYIVQIHKVVTNAHKMLKVMIRGHAKAFWFISPVTSLSISKRIRMPLWERNR